MPNKNLIEDLKKVHAPLLHECTKHEDCSSCPLIPEGDYDVCPTKKLESIISGMELRGVIRSMERADKRCGTCKHLTADWPSYLKIVYREKELDQKDKRPVCAIRNAKRKDDMQQEYYGPCKYYEPGIPFMRER